jgi:hypothetical protein
MERANALPIDCRVCEIVGLKCTVVNA